MEFVELLSDPALWVAFLTLTILEIVLGIDNLIFISIVSERLPSKHRHKARLLGIVVALLMRMILLLFIAQLLKLEQPIFSVADHSFSWRDVIFVGGGIFLLGKATFEIVSTVEGSLGSAIEATATSAASFGAVVLQIVLLDMVFSIDSILTAFGVTRQIPIMVAAIVISMVVMVVAAKALAEFVNRHVSVKILALAFLLLIGVVLVSDGLGVHIPRPYIYFALAFSMSVQALTLMANRPKRINLR